MSLKDEFNEKLIQKIQSEFNLSSVSAVPKLEKIVVNMGIGKNRENKKFVIESIDDLMKITGQKPSSRKAKKSISNFKLRQGQVVGLTVTLRGAKMWAFYEKLVNIVLPRVKDFRGVKSTSFDEGGNYTLGLDDHMVFPEIDPNSITYTKPLEVTINTSSQNAKMGLKLLTYLGMPFKKI